MSQSAWKTRIPFLLTALNLLILSGTIFLARRPAAPPLVITPPPPTQAPTVTASPAPVRIYVSGAVVSPDVYHLAPASSVKDAILAAGGVTAAADCDHLNLARYLLDGEHIYVPRSGELVLPMTVPSRSSTAPGPININLATQAELESLPNIGPALAQGILARRPFASVDELEDVDGIGPSTLEKLRHLVTIGNP